MTISNEVRCSNININASVRFLPNETNVATLAPALENAIADASGGEGASKLNFTRLNENIASLSEVGKLFDWKQEKMIR